MGKHQKEHALDLVTKYLREARKYNGGITLASQSIRDFVPEGGTGVAIDKIKTVFELTQYKFIFNQDTNVIDLINNVFKNSLTERQINKIPRLELGDCILHISGDKITNFMYMLRMRNSVYSQEATDENFKKVILSLFPILLLAALYYCLHSFLSKKVKFLF